MIKNDKNGVHERMENNGHTHENQRNDIKKITNKKSPNLEPQYKEGSKMFNVFNNIHRI